MLISINSRLKWNDTRIDVIAGLTYEYGADGQWTDWTRICDADGYSDPKLDLLSFLKRCRSAQWFQLVAAVDQKASQSIVLGCSGQFIAPASGRLWAYANDAAFAYWNNNGSVALTITPPDQPTLGQANGSVCV
jgi:hypothetical protein